MNIHGIEGISEKKELPPLSKTKREIVDRLTNAAHRGIKELNVDSSGDTIVHDAIRLHDYKLFKAIFKGGIPYVNTANTKGTTPLLEAAANGDYDIVNELLKSGADPSINIPNQDGITPIHAAVASGNTKLVKLLLSHGAVESINIPNSKKVSPLHTAISKKDDKMIQLLLRHQAIESINLKDFKQLTPFQRAIIGGRVSAVQQMLAKNPHLAAEINKPDQHGVTHLQRAARSGNMEMMSLLIAHMVEEDIQVNPEASFPLSEAEACEMPSEIQQLKSVPIDQVAFPLTIAQNSCNVMIRMADSKILRVRNADAKEVRDLLMERKYGSEWKSDQGTNVLTMYLSPGHGFMRLECQNCDDGKPYNMNRGFWPGMKRLSEWTSKAPKETSPVSPPAITPYGETQEGIENTNMIFSVSTEQQIPVKTPSGATFKVNSTTLNEMIDPIIEEADPQKVAQVTYEKIQRTYYGNETPPSYSEVEEIAIHINDTQTVGNVVAEWATDNLQTVEESSQENPLSANDTKEMVQFFLNPSETSPGIQLAAIIENTVGDLIKHTEGSKPLMLQNPEIEGVANLMRDLMANKPASDIILHHFGKLGEDGINIVKMSALEAYEYSKQLGGGALAQKLGDTMLTAYKTAQNLADSTLRMIPGGKFVWEKAQKGPAFISQKYNFVNDLIYEQYLMTQEQVGNVGNEDWYENDSDTRNSLKIMFIVDDDQAKAALGAVKDVTQSCKDNPEKSCRYHMTTRNCVDFLQEVFTSAGGSGDFADYFTDEQLGHGHLTTPTRLYEFKAVDYTFIRSRGMPHYLRAGTYQTIGKVFNLTAWTGEGYLQFAPLPNKFVQIKELVPSTAGQLNAKPHEPEEASSKEQEISESIPMPTYNVSLTDNINLARTIAKMATNLFSGLADFWHRSGPGEKGATEDFQELKDHIAPLFRVLRKQDKLENSIMEEIGRIDEQIEHLKLEEKPNEGDLEKLIINKNKLVQLSDELLDLYFKGLEIKKQIKTLDKIYTVPNKKYVVHLSDQIQELIEKTTSLKNTFSETKAPL